MANNLNHHSVLPDRGNSPSTQNQPSKSSSKRQKVFCNRLVLYKLGLIILWLHWVTCWLSLSLDLMCSEHPIYLLYESSLLLLSMHTTTQWFIRWHGTYTTAPLFTCSIVSSQLLFDTARVWNGILQNFYFFKMGTFKPMFLLYYVLHSLWFQTSEHVTTVYWSTKGKQLGVGILQRSIIFICW